MPTLPSLRTLYIVSAIALGVGVLSASAFAAEDLSVYPNAESVVPLKVGSVVPSAIVRSIDGEPVDLAIGFPVVAISPDRPKKLIESRKAESLGYALYSDNALNAARAFGIAFQLDDATRKRYAIFGINLEDLAGTDRGQLPVPSVFLVDAAGTIRWVYSNPDYTTRPKNEELLAVARGAAAREGRRTARDIVDSPAGSE